MSVSITGVTIKNKGLIKGKQITAKNESSLTFRTCLLYHYPQRRVNQIHIHDTFSLTLSVQDHFWSLTLQRLEVSLYPSSRKTVQGQKNNARTTVSKLAPTLFYKLNRFYWVGKNLLKQ